MDCENKNDCVDADQASIWLSILSPTGTTADI